MMRRQGRDALPNLVFAALVITACAAPTSAEDKGASAPALFSVEGLEWQLGELRQMLFAVDVANNIAFDTQPAGGSVGGALTTQPVVGIHVSGGALVGSGADANAPITVIISQGLGNLTGTITVNAVNGQATFTNLSIDTPGPVVLTAIKANTALAPSTGVTRGTPPMYVDSSSFTVSPGNGNILVFTTQPGGGGAGVTWPTQPVVKIYDPNGNLVTSGTDSTATVTLSPRGGAGALTGTASKAAVGGVATFTGLSMQTAGSGFYLNASATINGTPHNSNSSTFIVTPGACTSVAFTTQPGNGNATRPLVTMPVVSIYDTYTNVVTSGADANAQVKLTLTSGTGVLSGVASKYAGAGIADFTGSNLSVNLAGTGKRLTATGICAGGNYTSVSNTFTINANSATRIVFASQPLGGSAGAAWAGGNQPVINILDNSNNVVALGADSGASVSVAIGQGPGTLSGTTTVTASSGVATFTNLKIDKANPNTTLVAIKASTTGAGGAGVLTANSNTFAINVGTAVALAFSTQPGNANAAANFSPQPVVQVQDANGNLVTTTSDATASISVTLRGGAGPLLGTTSATASGGIATFTGLHTNIAGATYLLNATANLSGNAGANANSTTFVVAALPPTTLQFITQPGGGTAGTAWATQPNVIIVDNYGNLASNSNDGNTLVTLTLTTGPGVLGGTTSMSGVAGIANFAGKGLNVNQINNGDVITATANLHTGTASTTSSTFNITAGGALSANWIFPPGGSANYTFGGSIVYTAGGNVTLFQNPHTDSNMTNFNAGTYTCTSWDSTNNWVRLNSTTNCAALDSSWAPRWSKLYGYWSLDGTGSVAINSNIAGVDSGGNTVNLLANGGSAIPYATAHINQGLTLNGTNHFLSLPAYFYNSGDITISMWANITSTSAYQRFFDFGYDAYSWMAAWVNNSTIVYSMVDTSDGGSPSGSGFGPGYVALNQWNHLAARYDGTSFTVYLNGVPYGSYTINYPLSAVIGANNWFGKSQTAVSNGDPYFQGSYDEIAIWKAALSPNEIKSIYGRQLAPYAGYYTSRVMDAFTTQNYNTIAWTTTLPFYKEIPSAKVSESSTAYANIVSNLQTNSQTLWHFDERAPWTRNGGSASINDDTGNGNYLVCSSYMTYNVLGAFLNTVGFPGAACALQSSTGSLSAYSISTWLNTAQTFGSAIIAFGSGQYLSSNQNDIMRGFYMSDAGKIYTNLYANSVRKTAASTKAYNDGRWHHLLSTYSSPTLTLYVDGVKVGSTGSTTNPNILGNGGYWNIGYENISGTGWSNAPGNNNQLQGLVDETAVWGRAVTATEANQLWRRGSSRLKFHVRSCSDSACATGTWMGPDGTSTTYFSELFNVSGSSVLATSPSLTFLNYTTMGWGSGRYFQYRAYFESDDVNNSCSYDGATGKTCSAELTAVAISPNHYDASMPSVVNANTVSFHNLTGFAANVGTCTGGVTFQVSYDGSHWYYWSGAAWALATSSVQSSTAATINSHISTFASTVNTGSVYFQAFLGSNGATPCLLQGVTITGTQ